MAGSFTAKYKSFMPAGEEDVWIETGTYRGNGVVSALGLGFREVHTVEVYPERFQELESNNSALCHDPRVHRYLGSSRDWLPVIIGSVTDRNVVFWLDGHYQGESQEERDRISECPVVDELKAIVASPWKRSVLVCVDDSNLFTDAYWENGFRRERFTPEDWPREDDIATIMQGWRSTNEDNILYFYR
jgi:hypothetical protein